MLRSPPQKVGVPSEGGRERRSAAKVDARACGGKYRERAKVMCPTSRANEKGAPRDKDLSRAAHEVRRENNGNPAGGPAIGADRGRRRENVSMGQLGSPRARSYVVPVCFLEESDTARRVVVEETALLIVEGGGMIEEPAGIPDQERGRRGRGRQTIRRDEVGDSGVSAQGAPGGVRRGKPTTEDTPQRQGRSERGKPFAV